MGDVAIVALDRLDEPVGAAWYRIFAPTRPATDSSPTTFPELSIAVYPECRGQRVGSLLLGTLVSRARADGYRAISLSVAAANPARRLYKRHGFEPPRCPDGANGDGSITMVLDLDLMRRNWHVGPAGFGGRPAERMEAVPDRDQRYVATTRLSGGSARSAAHERLGRHAGRHAKRKLRRRIVIVAAGPLPRRVGDRARRTR